jgi:hypothetical protein
VPLLRRRATCDVRRATRDARRARSRRREDDRRARRWRLLALLVKSLRSAPSDAASQLAMRREADAAYLSPGHGLTRCPAHRPSPKGQPSGSNGAWTYATPSGYRWERSLIWGRSSHCRMLRFLPCHDRPQGARLNPEEALDAICQARAYGAGRGFKSSDSFRRLDSAFTNFSWSG